MEKQKEKINLEQLVIMFPFLHEKVTFHVDKSSRGSGFAHIDEETSEVLDALLMSGHSQGFPNPYSLRSSDDCGRNYEYNDQDVYFIDSQGHVSSPLKKEVVDYDLLPAGKILSEGDITDKILCTILPKPRFVVVLKRDMYVHYYRGESVSGKSTHNKYTIEIYRLCDQ